MVDLGIDLDAIAVKPLDDVVAAFVKAFEALTASISAKRAKLPAGKTTLAANLRAYQPQGDAVPA